MRLIDRIEQLNDIRDKTQSKVSDDVIWDCATRIYNCPTHKEEQKAKQRPATQGQINFLRGLKVKIPEGLTSKEASKLIEENKKK